MADSNGGLSASDVVAMMGNRDGFLGGGTGFIILLFIFIWAVFGGNGFNAGNNSDLVRQQDLYTALNGQTLENEVRDGNAGIIAAINGVGMQVQDNKFVSQLGFQNLGAQVAACCSETQKTIIEENQRTRDLIQANYINELQTNLSDMKTALNNAEQTKSLLDTMGRWVGYAGYGSCSFGGCNCNTALNS